MADLRERSSGGNAPQLSVKKRYSRQNQSNHDNHPNDSRPIVTSPNKTLPGNWWESFSHNNKDASTENRHNVGIGQEDNSIDEFFETNDQFTSIHHQQNRPLSPTKVVIDALTSATLDDFDPRVEPHMTEPLLPDDSPLDFSCLMPQKGKTNINTASPLARAWEFNTKIDIDECSLLNIFADEFENLNCGELQQKLNFWDTLKRYTRGISDDEYDGENPWAKYCTRKGDLNGN